MVGVSLFFKQKTAYEMRISDWSSDVCSSDLNGRDMAELCNVSPKTISHVERGLAKINTEILQALVRKKNLNVNWLLTGKGHPIAGAAERRIDAVDVRGSVDMLEKRLLRLERLIGSSEERRVGKECVSNVRFGR